MNRSKIKYLSTEKTSKNPRNSTYVWSIHIKPYLCMAVTISSALRIEKINSINRSCELPISWIITTPNIIFDSIPNNLKPYDSSGPNLTNANMILKLTMPIVEVLFAGSSRILDTSPSESNNWLFCISNFIQFNWHLFQLILNFFLFNCCLFWWLSFNSKYKDVFSGFFPGVILNTSPYFWFQSIGLKSVPIGFELFLVQPMPSLMDMAVLNKGYIAFQD